MSKQIPLIDLKAQYESIKSEVDQAIAEVVATQQFRLGPKLAACEEEVAAYSGARFGCGVSSGTDALLLALMAEQIGPGDEVILPAQSFFATAGCVVRLGATPVFADIDPQTYTIDPTEVKKKITSRTKAIIPVHLYGQTAEMNPILELAKKSKLVVVEDGAQAIGAEYQNKRAGSLGDYGCFSFFPGKNLGAFGDGGMIVTNDEERLEKLIRLREHGESGDHHHPQASGNFRLDAIQAAVVSAKLPHLDGWIEKRRQNAARYTELFSGTNLLTTQKMVLPIERQTRHSFHQYVLLVKRRDALRHFLNAERIACGVYYPVPLPLDVCFQSQGHKPGAFPVSEHLSNNALAIPVYPELSDEQLSYIVSKIEEFYQ